MCPFKDNKHHAMKSCQTGLGNEQLSSNGRLFSLDPLNQIRQITSIINSAGIWYVGQMMSHCNDLQSSRSSEGFDCHIELFRSILVTVRFTTYVLNLKNLVCWGMLCSRQHPASPNPTHHLCPLLNYTLPVIAVGVLHSSFLFILPLLQTQYIVQATVTKRRKR